MSKPAMSILFRTVVAILLPLVALADEPRIERLSVSSTGTQTFYYGSNAPSASADGRFVAFWSSAENLVQPDTNEMLSDVFVRDRGNGSTERISVSSNGEQGNSTSFYPSISADGRFVAYVSLASNLVVGNTNGFTDVFVYDRETRQTDLVSVGSGGEASNGHSGLNFHVAGNEGSVAISADGRFVAFQSYAGNLVVGNINGYSDVFVRDRLNGTTERVSIRPAGTEFAQLEGSMYSLAPAISADGRYVAFQSHNPNRPTDAQRHDIFVHDRGTGLTEIISVDPAGGWASENSYSPAISADGRFVAFHSAANNLADGGSNGNSNIFVRDRLLNKTELVSRGLAGEPANADCWQAAISDDGRHVAFVSSADNLVAGDTNGAIDIFVFDRSTGTLKGITLQGTDDPGKGSYAPKFCQRGACLVFESTMPNLVPDDTNGTTDVFLYGAPVPAFLQAHADIDLDGFPDLVVLDGTLHATIKRDTGAWINRFRFDVAFPAVGFLTIADFGGTPAPELVALGADGVAEVRDGLSGELLTVVSFDADLEPVDLDVITASDGGTPILAMLGKGDTRIELRDAATGGLVGRISYPSDRVPVDLQAIKDISGDGRGDLAVLEQHPDPTKHSKIELRDGATGRSLGALWVGKGFTLRQLVSVEDIGGIENLATLRTGPDTVNVLVQDPASGLKVNGIGYSPIREPQLMIGMPDADGNGSGEIAVIARNPLDGDQRLVVKDAVDSSLLFNVWFPRGFEAKDASILSDLDGNGADELAVLVRRPSDSRLRVFVFDGQDGERHTVVYY
jgi:Tol biopolymer transport system component